MPQQLIYTSAQRGLVVSRDGYCTVARSADMREALMLRLEQMSNYQHVSLTGGKERPVFASRIVEIRGTTFHVLSRIQDAGTDFKGRTTNFIAHHVAFTPEEIRRLPAPAVILRDWTGWVTSWNEEPRMFQSEEEKWPSLFALAGKSCLPARTWQQFTGDTVNAFAPLDAKPGAIFRVDDVAKETLLGLLAESAELAAAREPHRDVATAAWQQTFVTNLQKANTQSEFRWCCLYTDSPVFAEVSGPDRPLLASLRAAPRSEVETRLAQGGWQPPLFRIQPGNVRARLGDPAVLRAQAEGVPAPAYQWYSVDGAGNRNPIPGQTAAVLTLTSAPFGNSHFVCQATNSAGEVSSSRGTISVEDRAPRIATGQPATPSTSTAKRTFEVKVEMKVGEDGEEEWKKAERMVQKKQAEEKAQATRERNRSLLMLGLVILAVGGFAIWLVYSKRSHASASLGATPPAETNRPPETASTNQGTPPAPVLPDANTNAATVGASNTNSPPAAVPAVNATAPTPPTSTPGDNADNKSASETPAPPPPKPSPPPSDNAIGSGSNLKAIALPWRSAEIGDAKAVTGIIDGKFFLRSDGQGIFSKQDQFSFLFQEYSGDFDLIATVSDFSSESKDQFGVMARQSNYAGSPFAFVGFISDTVHAAYREKDDSSTVIRNKTSRQIVKSGGGSVRLRLKLEKNVFSAYYLSDDGKAHMVGALTNTAGQFKATLSLGFVVFSGNPSKPADARFELDPKSNPKP